MKKLLLIISAICCVSLFSCGDDEPEVVTPPTENPDDPSKPDPDDPDDPNKPDEPDDPNPGGIPTGSNLYATGYSDAIMYSFWWNYQDKKLNALCSESENSEAHAIAVGDDGTIYIGGVLTSDEMNGYEAAALWTNGKSQLLTKMDRPTDAAVYGLAIDGNDVWAAGFYRYLKADGWSFQRDAATLWKNGTQIDITHGERYAKAWDVKIKGDKAYVVGELNNADGFSVATMWTGDKNSTDWSNCETLSLGNGINHSYAEEMCIDGNDIYAVGNKTVTTGGEYKIAVMWKNGKETELSQLQSYATSVSVDKGIVYIAGWEYVEINGRDCAVATLWVDGKAQHLYNKPHSSQARCVIAKDGNVYVSGFIGDQAVIWINGEAGALTDGTYPSCVTSLYLK